MEEVTDGSGPLSPDEAKALFHEVRAVLRGTHSACDFLWPDEATFLGGFEQTFRGDFIMTRGRPRLSVSDQKTLEQLLDRLRSRREGCCKGSMDLRCLPRLARVLLRFGARGLSGLAKHPAIDLDDIRVFAVKHWDRIEEEIPRRTREALLGRLRRSRQQPLRLRGGRSPSHADLDDAFDVVETLIRRHGILVPPG